jgi:hypothetical protein
VAFYRPVCHRGRWSRAFFIDWQDSPHPSQRGLEGVTVVGFRAEHPDPAPVRRMLSHLGLDLTAQAGQQVVLIADPACPRGA